VYVASLHLLPQRSGRYRLPCASKAR